ncbi:MAG: endonuclease/exonuclease/phosphatase family protein [Myxococcota bacterium]|nr:endonuclease/exonuclease/phosphatase family protein [Myxococcota bacterium]
MMLLAASRGCAAVIATALVVLLAGACGGAARTAAPQASAATAEAPNVPAAPAAIHVPIRSIAELSIMSFNLRYVTSPDGENDWDHRASLVVDVIRSADPDVIALQEDALVQVELILEALPSYSAIGLGSADGREGGELVALLYRSDRLRVDDRGVFWLSERPTEPGSRGWGAQYARICTWAIFRDRGNGQSFLVYDTHLDHRSTEARANGLAMIARHIRERGADHPVVVAGDLNLTPDDEALAGFLAATGLTDTYRDVHREPGADEATYHGFRGGVDGPRLDFILAGAGARARAAEIVRTRSDEGHYPSDHYPITTTIHVSRTE